MKCRIAGVGEGGALAFVELMLALLPAVGIVESPLLPLALALDGLLLVVVSKLLTSAPALDVKLVLLPPVVLLTDAVGDAVEAVADAAAGSSNLTLSMEVPGE